MCMRCEGYSEEEIDRSIDLVIRVHGYLIQQVTDEYHPWTYTVGIQENHGQAELLCVDIDLAAQARLVKTLADDVARCGRVREVLLRALDVELVEVDEAHLRDDLVVVWEDRYDRSAQRGDFLQIVPGPSWFCDHHAQEVRRLDDPATHPSGV